MFVVAGAVSLAAALVVRSRLANRNALQDSLVARWLTLLIALGFAAGGLFAIVDLGRDPNEMFDGASLAYVLSCAMLVGGLIYAAGTVLWTGGLAFDLRVAGALLVAFPLTFSMVLALAFPIAAILFVTLAEVPRRERREPAFH